LKRVFELCQQLLGENHPDALTSANNLAISLRALGAHERARQLEVDVRAHRKG
jgi:Tetratricopeptide repeat